VDTPRSKSGRAEGDLRRAGEAACPAQGGAGRPEQVGAGEALKARDRFLAGSLATRDRCCDF
jgi:hypothetical protein